MAAEKVYGIAESKSAVEVPRKTEVYTKDETYPKSWVYNILETYSITEIRQKFLQKTDGAPKNHASADSTYGLGTANNFGHCKLTTSLDIPSGNQDGIALAGSMGYMLKTYIDNVVAPLQSAVAELQAALATVGQIPVGGVVAFTDYYSDVSVITEKMGYGTWLYQGSISGQTIPGSIFFYERER